MRGILQVLVICLSTLVTALPAHATLGDKAASAEADRVRLKARMNVGGVSAATVHELTQDNGTVVREFSNSQGVIFAVTWTGVQRPNLRQLFGSGYFNRFQAANTSGRRIQMRRAMRLDDIDFRVRTGGHSGAFWGYAILPAQVPAGFDRRELIQGAQ